MGELESDRQRVEEARRAAQKGDGAAAQSRSGGSVTPSHARPGPARSAEPAAPGSGAGPAARWRGLRQPEPRKGDDAESRVALQLQYYIILYIII